MRVALCGRFNTDKKHQGGSAEVFLALAERLSKNHTVTVFGRGKPTQEIVDMCRRNGIMFYYIPSDSLLNILLGPIRTGMLLKKHFDNFDIIHTHTGSFAIASILFKNKSKIITQVHELPMLKENSIKVNAYLLLETFLVRLAAKNSQITIAQSEYMTDIIASRWNIKNVVSIKLGIDTEKFRYKRDKKFDDVYYPHSTKLLYVGRLTKRKGILELLASLEYLGSKNMQLCVVGNGELRTQVQNIASQKGVKYIQSLQNSDLAYLFSAADLVIVPSRYEPAGIVPLEALSCGTRVLVAANTGLKEIAIASFIDKVEPQTIAACIDRTLQSVYPSREECREYILKNHSWDMLIKQYESLYSKLCSAI